MSILRPEPGQKLRVPYAKKAGHRSYNDRQERADQRHLNRKSNVDTSFDDGFWQQHAGTASYQIAELDYARDLKPAYQLVHQLYLQQDVEDHFDHAVNDLEARWNASKGQSRLNWQQAKGVIVEAWNTLMNYGIDKQNPH